MKSGERGTEINGWGYFCWTPMSQGRGFLANEITQKMNPDVFSVEIQVYPGRNKSEKSGSGIAHVKAFLVSERNGKIENQPHINYGISDCCFIGPEPKWKRVLDVTGAVLGMIFLFPLFLIIVAYIKVVSPGPVFFRQERIGFRRKPFTIWKFRTMHVCAETECHQEHAKAFIKNGTVAMEKLDTHDPRIIPFAKILRATGLDELPQLFNIIKGDMSLVGPAPAWLTRLRNTACGSTKGLIPNRASRGSGR